MASNMDTSGKEVRDSWGSRTEYILSNVGYIIGIGNVWRFPYLCYISGGGAFLIPYLLMLIFAGIPLFFMETSLGQFTNSGCIPIFNISPLFKGVGYAIVVTNFICTCYLNVIISYALAFLANCFTYELPWATCNNPWNTQYCTELHISDGKMINISYVDGNTTPSEEFFHNKILQISSDVNEMGTVVWSLFICNAVTWMVVYLCIMKGVKSVGKVVYFTATFPYIIMIILLSRGLTLPGALNGISYYLYPEWSKLKSFKIWTDAAVQIFFSLGPGWGGLVNMASYNDFKQKNKRMSIVVPIINCATSILCGFVVFSILGFMSHETGKPVSTVATGGPGLAFVTYPEAITLLPWPHLWAALFFIMLFLVGLDTNFVLIETVISAMIDEYYFLRKYKYFVSFVVCLIAFGCSTFIVTNGGMFYLQALDWYLPISVLIIALFEIVIIAWIYGAQKFVRDVEFMLDEKLSWWWISSWKYVTPLLLAIICAVTMFCTQRVSYKGVEYPDWAVALGWGSCWASILCIPVYMGYKLLYFAEGSVFERFRSLSKSNSMWGPSENIHRIKWNYLVLKKYTEKSTDIADPIHMRFLQLATDDVE